LSRILIAEDERQLAAFLQKGLRAAGYATSVRADGISAAASARDADYELLILDLGLPGQDGFAVLRELRGRRVRMPVLVLTARRRVEDAVAALESGADDYLTKPFSFDELLARLRARFRSGDAEPRGDDARVAANVVEVYVSLLRRKLGAERIETVRGVGYRMPA